MQRKKKKKKKKKNAKKIKQSVYKKLKSAYVYIAGHIQGL